MITLNDIFVTLSAALLLLLLYYKHAFNYFKSRGVATLPPTFPFGNSGKIVFRQHSMNDTVTEIYTKLKAKGHKYAGLYFFTEVVYIPIDVTLIKNMLSKDFGHFEDRGIYYDEEYDPVSAHLFSLHGQKWKALRSKLTPAFTAGKVRYMFQAILSCATEMVDVLNAQSELEIKEIFARYTTDVIGSCAFGIECNSQKNPDAEFRVMGNRAFTHTPMDVFRNIVIRRSPGLAKLLKLSVFPKVVINFFKAAVQDTIAFRERHNVTRNDFLQLLIKMINGEKLDDDKFGASVEQNNNLAKQDEIKALTLNEATAQAFIFFLAGFETTSTSLSFAMFEMAFNEKIQDRARKEILKVLRKYHCFTYDCIAELQYIELVILESLRKYPPAPVYFRKCTKDYRIPDSDVVIEKDTMLLLPTMAVHRDPEYYDEPELFDPERFTDENRHKIRDGAYFPFGDGPRKCLGMRFAMVQSKLALALLLKNFKFTVSPKTQLPLVMKAKEIVVEPIGGLWLKLEKIEQ